MQRLLCIQIVLSCSPCCTLNSKIKMHRIDNCNENSFFRQFLAELSNAYRHVKVRLKLNTTQRIFINYNVTNATISLSIYGSTALCWASDAFQFLELLHSRYDSLDGESARRKTVTCTQDSINAE
jgi:hypothetical protein